ncbi:MAG: 2-phospho-L-lactate guanylyltransferase [Nitriliruptor sp.]|nr:MAG: 2-phospho-L-lactate guanylyltransferase [Nitriliruptor sp.]
MTTTCPTRDLPPTLAEGDPTASLLAMDPTVALVPLRAPGEGKSRLADVLDPEQRAALSVAMLDDVAASLAAAGLPDIVLVAGGQAAAMAGRDLGLDVLLDPAGCRGLDDALAAASRRIGHHRHILIVAADLPRLRPDDVQGVLEPDAEVVIAPTAAGGTGALLRRPAAVIGTAYGPGSAIAHRALAVASGARAACVDRDGIHHDVDTFTDLVALTEVELGPATAAVLPQLLGPHPLRRQPVG